MFCWDNSTWSHPYSHMIAVKNPVWPFLDVCHCSSTEGSRLLCEQPPWGAWTISSCSSWAGPKHCQMVGCKFHVSCSIPLIVYLSSTWFKLHMVQYPTLSHMAHDYLTIQDSAVPSEWAFSSSGLTATSARSSKARPEAGLGSGFQWAWAWLKVQKAQSPGFITH